MSAPSIDTISPVDVLDYLTDEELKQYCGIEDAFFMVNEKYFGTEVAFQRERYIDWPVYYEHHLTECVRINERIGA